MLWHHRLAARQADTGTPAAQVRNLHKEYTTKARGTFVTAAGIDLDIEANSITALVGPSGSGVRLAEFKQEKV